MKYILEGMPGAGKSTFMNSLKTSFEYVGTVYFDQPQVDDSIMQSGDKILIARTFIAEELKRQNNILSTDNIIFDRNYISTIAYNYAMSRIDDTYKAVFDDIEQYSKTLALNKSIDNSQSKMFVLIADLSESITRRSEFNEEKYFPWFDRGFLLSMLSFYKDGIFRDYYDGEYVILDTTNLNREDIFVMVSEQIV